MDISQSEKLDNLTLIPKAESLMENIKQPIYDNSFDIQEFVNEQKEKLAKEPEPNIIEMLGNAKDGKQGTGFAFTYNNFLHTPDELGELLKQMKNICFYRFQIEEGDTGTIHYQGYIHFEKRVYWGTVRRYFIKNGLHRISHRNRIAKPINAADYCKKIFDDKTGEQTKLTEPVYEWGDPECLTNEQGKRNDMEAIVEMVRENKTDAEILEAYPTQFFRYSKSVATVRKTLREKEFEDKFRIMEVVYIYGSPRSGKTRHIMEKYGYKNVCRVTVYEKWLFENYKGQPVVLYDEFDGNRNPKITEMNDYIDGYPYAYRCRNEDRVAMNDKVFIISNLPLNQQYTREQAEKPQQFKAFTDRITHIINWDNLAEREHFIRYGKSLPQKIPQQSQMEMIPVTDENLPF